MLASSRQLPRAAKGLRGSWNTDEGVGGEEQRERIRESLAWTYNYLLVLNGWDHEHRVGVVQCGE